MYATETGPDEYKLVAHQAMTFALYAIEDDGHPFGIMGPERKDSWQEDLTPTSYTTSWTRCKPFPNGGEELALSRALVPSGPKS